MTEFKIEVVGDNPFNEGWLSYVLGRPRLDEGQMAPGMDAYIDGWDMAAETPSMADVRMVFVSQEGLAAPQYRVSRP